MSVQIATVEDFERLTGQVLQISEQIEALTKALNDKDTEALSPYVTVREAAQILSLSEDTIRRHCRCGKYEIKRNGGKNIQIKRSSI